MKIQLRQLILLLLLLLVPVAGCSFHGRKGQSGEVKHRQPTQEQRLAAMRKKVNPLLEKGHYSRALEVVCDRHLPNQPLAGMEKEYLTAVNGLLEVGEESMSRLDYGSAGQCFKTALDVFPAEPSLVGKIKSSERRLKIYLDTCSNKLMEQGLEEYRRGELERAIKTWKTIIAFRADHNDARKAIETATVQKKSLQNLD